MALKARQITLVTSTATPLVVKGSTGTQFVNAFGGVQDPIPYSIKNEDAAITVWIGGPDVDATHGQSLAAGQSMQFNLYGDSEVPYAFAVGTPIVSVLAGRQ